MKARIRTGRRRHLLTIQTRTSAVDTEGNPVVTWVNAGSAWASVEPGRSLEPEQADQLEQQTMFTVTMPYPNPVTHESRLLFGTRVLDVRSVVNIDERNRQLEVMCLERIIG